MISSTVNHHGHRGPKVAYVVKMYPRFSETFIITEILAHEAAGLDLEIFSLRPPVDTHFQDLLALVRSPVRYVAAERPRVTDLWEAMGRAGRMLPQFWESLPEFSSEDPRDVLQAALLAIELTRDGFTHIHAHFATVATTVARMASRFSGIPYTFTAHAKDIFHESVDPADFRRKLRDASAVVTVSEHNLEYLRGSYGTDASVVRRVYNGLDLSQFSYVEPSSRPPLVVGVGRLVEKKGFDDLVRACAILRQQGVAFRCQLIGAGLMENELASLITELGLENLVEITGPLPQAEVRRRVQDASVLAAPCVTGADGNRDGLPTVLLESMALGTPCISTAVAGIPEAIRHMETGMIVADRNPGELASAIRMLFADSSQRVRLARAARKLVEDQFDIRRNSEHIRALFLHLRDKDAEAA